MNWKLLCSSFLLVVLATCLVSSHRQTDIVCSTAADCPPSGYYVCFSNRCYQNVECRTNEDCKTRLKKGIYYCDNNVRENLEIEGVGVCRERYVPHNPAPIKENNQCVTSHDCLRMHPETNGLSICVKSSCIEDLRCYTNEDCQKKADDKVNRPYCHNKVCMISV